VPTDVAEMARALPAYIQKLPILTKERMETHEPEILFLKKTSEN
jgi:hypothetical protein